MIPLLEALLAVTVAGQAEGASPSPSGYGVAEAAARHKLEFAAEAVPADVNEGAPPVIRVKGVTGYPDDTRLRLHLHADRKMQGVLKSGDVRVRGGRFSCDLEFFRKRNLPGGYTLRVQFNPHLQRILEARAFPSREETLFFAIGTDEDRLKALLEVTARLVGQLDGIYTLKRLIEDEYQRRKGRPFDPSAWSAFSGDLVKRSLEIEKEAYRDPDYVALGLSGISDHSFEGLRDKIVLYAKVHGAMLAEHGNRDYVAGASQIRAVLDKNHRQLLEAAHAKLPPPSPEEGIVRIREVCGLLDRSLGLSGVALKEAEKEFKSGILALHRVVPFLFYDKVVALTGVARSFFAALEEDRAEEARKHLEELRRGCGVLKACLERSKAHAPVPEKERSGSGQD